MQMLNFVKIPKMLLLLQLISINAQLNYPNTVTVHTITPDVSPRKPISSPVEKGETIVKIKIKSVHSKKTKSVNDSNDNWFYFSRKSDEPIKFQEACSLAYQKSMAYNNLSDVKFTVSVKINTPVVPPIRPNGETIVILKVKSVYSGTINSVIDRWFPTVAKPDARLKSQKACSLFKPLLKQMVPVHYHQKECRDDFSKPYFDNGNTAAKLNITSNCQFSHQDFEDLDHYELYKSMKNLFGNANFNKSMAYNNLSDVDPELSIHRNFPSAAIHY
uniref:Uncharacterized protein n=1 Tax=Schistosoma japonicum TaxID=6182 RepID=C7TYF5_SCHJA|nr:hypothetical protein [Schistosoma japonicum]